MPILAASGTADLAGLVVRTLLAHANARQRHTNWPSRQRSLESLLPESSTGEVDATVSQAGRGAGESVTANCWRARRASDSNPKSSISPGRQGGKAGQGRWNMGTALQLRFLPAITP
ncbi:hypothetical protein VDGL01_03798 [Verticillium dahliae]